MERVMSFNPMLRIVIVAVATGTLQKARIAAPAKQLAKFSRLALLAVHRRIRNLSYLLHYTGAG